jgi:hypothetical protein
MHSKAILTFVVALTVPLIASAQPAQTLDDMARKVRPGQTVVVTDTSGARIHGRLLDVSPSEMVVDADGTRRVEASAIAKVQRTDSVWNGLLIGAAAGGVVAMLGISETRGSDSVYVWGYGMSWALPAAGATVGALLDKAVTATIYVAPARTTGGSSPGPGAGQLAVHVAWRF